MRLIRGTPGSGKTALVLREFKQALGAGLTDLRIIVPTATLVRHFRHELARDGIVFSPKLIVSLSRFAHDRANDRASRPDLIPDDLLAAIVRECLRSVKVPEFAAVADTEGMVATIVETIPLFENAACTPDKLAAVKRLPPHAKAFERIWRAVSEYQARTGCRTRMEIVRAAAANTQPARIWMDGFLNFSPLETELVRSLARSCDLTLTIDDSAATDDIRKLALELGAKDQPLPAKSRKPRLTVTEARSLEREADEIARRITELNRAGVPFRQVGVAIRDTSAYLALLRTTFDRFGIPARFYFSSPLRAHPVAIFLGGLIDGGLAGWDFETTIETLRQHPKWGRTADFDRFDFTLREAMPGHGADALLALCESDWLRNEIAACLKTSAWNSDRQTPAVWQRRLEHFATTLYRPGTLEAPAERAHAAIAAERSHAAALQAWIATIESILSFWPDAERAIPLEEFWRIASAAIDGAVLQIPDDRAQVVHVMSAYEARQWDLQVLFVCGMVDRDFPKRHPQNLLFPDSEIDKLHKSGIPLRKASELENQERWLFDSLKTRATSQLFLSYPVHDSSGKSAQRSRFIEEIQSTPERATPCKPAAIAKPHAAGEPGQIHAPGLLAELTGLHQSISLTALEDLAQCRFKFFAGRTLSLKSAPERPGGLQPRLTGLILHETLERWLMDKERNFVEVFEKTFDDSCRKHHLPPGYRLEVERIQSREVAQKVSARELWKPDSSDVEVDLTLDFPGGVTVKCRIDRIDRFGASDCVIVDYKSGKNKNVKNLVESPTKLQGPLYSLAVRERLNLNPIAILFWAVREDARHGWGQIPNVEERWKEIPQNWEVDARARTIERLTEFLHGAVKAHPEEKDHCRWCDFINACRVEQQALISITASAEGAS